MYVIDLLMSPDEETNDDRDVTAKTLFITYSAC